MMRSFGSRADTFVSDEPFYGCFLKTTGAPHPVREIDGRALTCRGPMVERLQKLYAERVDRDAEEQQRP
jgi:hypothetical protein